ncbi:hypothetical protein EVAR_6977_1 [Eumeta japonica]|uniref:Uncharacterized protein n=1 Tax=Eumeta variegata TaxID=151549 RepID=A0A4C1TJ66_EUMVA|nr:hypothetical protein EVAR_6977_1 [Eumeta japonica]
MSHTELLLVSPVVHCSFAQSSQMAHMIQSTVGGDSYFSLHVRERTILRDPFTGVGGRKSSKYHACSQEGRSLRLHQVKDKPVSDFFTSDSRSVSISRTVLTLLNRSARGWGFSKNCASVRGSVSLDTPVTSLPRTAFLAMFQTLSNYYVATYDLYIPSRGVRRRCNEAKRWRGYLNCDASMRLAMRPGLHGGARLEFSKRHGRTHLRRPSPEALAERKPKWERTSTKCHSVICDQLEPPWSPERLSQGG